MKLLRNKINPADRFAPADFFVMLLIRTIKKRKHMFYKANGDGYKQVLPGIQIKTLTYGDLTLFTEFIMEKGSVLPRHSHVNEQT